MTGRKEFRSQMQESEQQLENLVRELKAAPATHNPDRILLANHVTATVDEGILSSSLRILSENSTQHTKGNLILDRCIDQSVFGAHNYHPPEEHSSNFSIQLRNLPWIFSIR